MTGVKTTLIKDSADSVCVDQCNAALGHGYCDLDASTPQCLCCPGWSGVSCEVSSNEDVGYCSSTNDIAGASSYLNFDNCYDTDVSGAQPSSQESQCSYPATGTWVDFCLVDNASIDENGDIDDAVFADVCDAASEYVDTDKTCEPNTECAAGEYDANAENQPNTQTGPRDCQPCGADTYAATLNAGSCSPPTYLRRRGILH